MCLFTAVVYGSRVITDNFHTFLCKVSQLRSEGSSLKWTPSCDKPVTSTCENRNYSTHRKSCGQLCQESIVVMVPFLFLNCFRIRVVSCSFFWSTLPKGHCYTSCSELNSAIGIYFSWSFPLLQRILFVSDTGRFRRCRWHLPSEAFLLAFADESVEN